jgi:hypothetical protein
MKFLKLAIPDHKHIRCQANLFMANVLAGSHYNFDVGLNSLKSLHFLPKTLKLNDFIKKSTLRTEELNGPKCRKWTNFDTL